MVPGQAPHMEAGEHVEAEIENLDEGPRHEPPEPVFGNGELRDDPLCLSRCAGAQAVCESRDFVGREAVEKEVRDDQVVCGGRKRKDESVTATIVGPATGACASQPAKPPERAPDKQTPAPQ